MSDKDTRVVMILEKSSHNLELRQDGDDVVLEGIFAQFGVLNNNERMYEENEYLPHLEYLNKKIGQNRLLGELDHPEKFDVSLTKVSHVIEKLEYDKGKRQIWGRVKLLNTPSGKIAKNLVEAGVPISISSRAAGLVESNKTVKIKKIFTYDLVADPGFENAVLSKMNESLGIHNDLLAVYDMTDKYPELLEENVAETAAETKTNTELMEFVTTEEMNAYSLLVKEEIEKLTTQLNSLNEANKSNELNEKVGAMNTSVEKMQKYLDYLANTNDKTIQYTEYVAEKLDKVIDYTNYVAKTLDESITYAEYVAKKTDVNIQYTEYLKEQMEKGIAYSEYLKECLEKSVDYAEYIAEKADQGIQYAEYVAEKADQGIQFAEYVGEKLHQTISYAEYLAESLTKGIAYSEYLAEQTQAISDYTEFAITETKKIAEKTMVAEEKVEEKEEEKIEYKSLPGKIDELLESIRKQKIEKVNDQHFGIMMLLDEAKRLEFKQMDEATKQKVLNALNDNAVKTEEDATRVWEAALTPHVERWVDEAPEEFKKVWETLEESAKNTLVAQSRSYKLETPYQIRNFWETRPRSILQKTMSEQKLNESTAVEPALNNPLGYSAEYVTMMSSLLDKFNRK
jgi:O-succinylbenzoate synthase